MNKWWKLSMVCALCIPLLGCVSRKEPQLELIDAVVRTVETETTPVTRVRKPGLDIHVETDLFRFAIALSSPSPKLIIRAKPPAQSVEFDTTGCFYQRDGGEKIALCVEALKRVDDVGQPRAPMLALAQLPHFSGVTLWEYQASQFEIETFESMSGERHGIYIPLRVGGEPYVIDASFELDGERSWHIGAPSMP